MNIHLDTGIVHIPSIQVASPRFGDKFFRRVHPPTEQQNISNLQLNAKNLSSQGFAPFGQRVVETVVEALRGCLKRDCYDIGGVGAQHSGNDFGADTKHFGRMLHPYRGPLIRFKHPLRTGWQNVCYLGIARYSQATGIPQVCLYGANPEIVEFHYQ